MILEDIWKGAAGLAGGVGKMAESAWLSSAVGQGLERTEQRREEHKAQMQQMKAMLRSQGFKDAFTQSQTARNQATTRSVDEGRGLYGGSGRQMDTSIDDAKTLSDIANAVTDEELVKKIEGRISSLLSPPKPYSSTPGQGFDPANKTPWVDNRGLLSGPDIVQGHSFAPGESKPKETPIGQGLGLGPEFFQVETPEEPERNIPKTHDQIGLQNKQAEEDYEEVRKFAEANIENFDIEQSYLENQEHYEKLFTVWREGVPDGKGGKRKLTKAEFIEILQSMGQ